MIINRHNYEEFFLLYVDNELSAAEREAVEAFVEQNPDLEEELVMMMQSVLRPDNNVVFANKESLLKNVPANGLVNVTNYEEYFVLYGDNELTNEEKDLVEQFVYKHPQYQAEFELIQQARLIPDHATIYPDKNELYRTEADDRVIPFRWWRIAAAAMVLLMLSVAGWYLMSEKKPAGTNPGIVNAGQKNNTGTKSNTVPAVVKDNEQMASKDNKKDAQDKTSVKKDEPVINDKNLANAEQKKIIPVKRNIKDNKIVTPKSIDESIAVNEQKKGINEKQEIVVEAPVIEQSTSDKVKSQEVNAKVINAGTITTTLAATTHPSSVDLRKQAREIVYYEEYASVDDSKKSGGKLLNKVKGLLGKKVVDENDDAPDNKKGIRIAAFEIALK